MHREFLSIPPGPLLVGTCKPRKGGGLPGGNSPDQSRFYFAEAIALTSPVVQLIR